jgi:2'-5' RNA ligase
MIENLETALIIVPGLEVQAFAAPLRMQYSLPASLCFPAHLTLLYPFMSPGEADRRQTEIEAVMETFAPFEIILDHYRRFDSAWVMEPRDPSPIITLQRQLTQAFPSFLPYGGEYGPDLVPHLTLASFDDAAQGDKVELPPPPNLRFTVDRIHLYYGPTSEITPSIPLDIFRLKGRS